MQAIVSQTVTIQIDNFRAFMPLTGVDIRPELSYPLLTCHWHFCGSLPKQPHLSSLHWQRRAFQARLKVNPKLATENISDTTSQTSSSRSSLVEWSFGDLCGLLIDFFPTLSHSCLSSLCLVCMGPFTSFGKHIQQHH